MKNRNFSSNKKAEKPSGLWLYGKHPVFSALQKKRREIFTILATKNTAAELEKFLHLNNISLLKSKIQLVDNHHIESTIGSQHAHQGFALNCSAIPIQNQNDLLEGLYKILEMVKLNDHLDKNKNYLPKLLIMDQLSDPRNIGSIIRSAAAFGVTKIIFPEHNFPKETAIINKSSSGMIENVDLIAVTNLNNLIVQLKEIGYWCIGLDGSARSTIDEIKNYPNVALIIGSEGDGIRSLVKKNCDLLVKISMAQGVESLNASVAAAIALHEMYIVNK
jgi:23S rRNA (guanosine2251-2'-O)-methyltransferase